MANVRSGKIFLRADGVMYQAKGSFTFNLGADKREGIVGSDGVHGYKITPQIPFIEGEIAKDADMDMKAFLELDGVTVTLELADGTVVVLRDAWFAGEGSVGTEEHNVSVRFEGKSAEEMK